MAPAAPPLQFLSPAWFSIVLGFAGLSLAWHRAMPLMGEAAEALALACGGVALLVFVALAAASVLRLQRHPGAWRDDRAHPVRHAFIAAIPVALILLATVSTALFGSTFVPPEARRSGVSPGWLQQVTGAVWGLGALSLIGVCVWVMRRWWLGNRAGGLQWQVLTPVLFIPVVGHVLVPLAGVPLGHAQWSAAQFGIGLLLWPVVLTLLLVRLATQGLWPERLMPSTMILVAPPAVIGVSAPLLGAPELLGWTSWGIALFMLLWVGGLLRRMTGQAFTIGHWAVSFPLAALAALTLSLARPGDLMAVLGPLLLAFTSVVFVGLTLGTVRGLRQGTLLAPEPIATLLPVGPG
ncbi:tellurite resistance protein [Sphaerotilus hippei]|uniref:Tellurite resistance protein n=1 Tax=Sphaerotilus hippei TaxID=744406 RepID=A0A318GZI2_9BURK|nr:C4-dicarboxylate ABC transporter [Sphaerotilus hippei]PXW95748.1 tellurite resistance protein [Sphaerotilus hippei]